MGAHGDLKLRHWLLISTPVALCLAFWIAVQLCGGYQTVRLRGFHLGRISELPQAERLAEKCVGGDFRVAKRAFGDDRSWRLLGTSQELDFRSCDWGQRLVDPASEAWLYRVDSGGSKILLFVKDNAVVGASGN